MTLELADIGTVLIEHSARAKRLNISVRPGRVRVAVPRDLELSTGHRFLLQQLAWVRQQQARLAELDQPDLNPVLPSFAAKALIIRRLNQLARQHNLPFQRVTIRSQRSRWGSCSSRNSLNLNIKLARLPAELLDYVLLHELVHTRVKNHGPDFWQALEDELPGARQLAKRLKQYPLDLL